MNQNQEPKKLVLAETNFSTKQLLTILQKTPKNHIYTRPAKGGGQWNYVTGVYVKKVLNYVFGWMWSFEVKSTEEKYNQVIVTGRLTVHDKSGNALLWKEDTGRADIKMKRDNSGPLDYGNDVKSANTDCLKRCAAQFGIASDIYGKNEFSEIKEEEFIDLPKPEKVEISKDILDKSKSKIEELKGGLK